MTDLVTTATCYIRPLSEEQSALNGLQWGQGYQVITETSVDIRVGDRVTIDSVLYVIKGMANHNRGGSLAYKKYLATLPQA